MKEELRSGKIEQTEVTMKNAERRKRFARSHEGLRLADYSDVCWVAENDGSAVLGKQVLRSGTSVGANYREAYRARSKPEFVSKCGDCLREIEETAYWLDLLAEADLVVPERLQRVRQECGELIAIFVTIPKRSKENLS